MQSRVLLPLLLAAAAVGGGTARAQSVSVGLTWHPSLPVPVQVVEEGLTTDLVYDAAGRLIALSQTDTTSHSEPYATAGQRRAWSYAYGIGNRVTAVDGPLPGPADTTTYAYTPEGRLSSVTDPAGLVTRVTAWNARGEPTRVEDPNGVATTYAYDGLGRVTAIVRDPGPSALRWSLTYTKAGDVDTLAEPSGRQLAFSWDGARRLVGITNNLGESLTFARNALGGITLRRHLGADGAVTFEEGGEFDELGRLIRQVGGEARSFAFAYDRTHKLTGITDPRNATIGFGYDGLGRLVSEVERDGGRVGHGYNGKSEETAYTDPGGLTTTYVRDGFGEVIEEVSPDRGRSLFAYDERGLMIRKVDGRGVETSFAYDAAGRLLERRYSDGTPPVTFSYDDPRPGLFGLGRLTGMADASGQSAYAYDAKGRLVRETRTIAGARTEVAYAYDHGGRLSRLTLPSGRTLVYASDGLGRVTGIGLLRTADAPAEPVVSDGAYRPEGPLRQLRFGNGMVLTRSYDREERITRLQVTGADGSVVLGRRYAVGDGLNLTEIVAEEGGGPDTLTLGYDPAQRLVFAGRAGESREWSYDLTGNRLRERQTVLARSDMRGYAYAPGTNRLAAIDLDGVAERTLAHDGAGNLVQEVRQGVLYRYGYDGPGQLAQVLIGSRIARLRATYTSDGRHRLAIRSLVNGVPDGTVHLIYDAQDHLLAETDPSGTVLREYVWLGDLPVAVLDGTQDPQNPVLLFVQADHLERPVLMAAADGTVVWRAAYDAFGAVREITGPASLDLRFPGQWFQLETGWHYNGHRHYDPTTGRYTTPDPLGLHEEPEPGGTEAFDGSWAGALPDVFAVPSRLGPTMPVATPGDGLRVTRDGPNLYAYAGSNPVSNVDPTGLWFGLPLVSIGAQSDICLGPLLQPAAKKRKSPTATCVYCGAPHGGLRGPYCKDCYDKSLKPNSDVPPIIKIPGTKEDG
jgi:RHS repeat-associated protein